MPDLTFPLWLAIVVLLAAAAVIGVVGTRLTSVTDKLADRTGLGEAFMGAVFLGAATSLPGITASVTAALDGDAQMALSNAIGGIAAQTAFLAIADLCYRKINLEHAAASVPNMMQATLLVILLGVLIVGTLAPPVSWLGIHPLTPLLFAAYVYGMKMVYRAGANPMWRPRMTRQTRVDEPEEEKAGDPSMTRMWVELAIAAGIVVCAGWAVTKAAQSLSEHTGINSSIAGALFTAVATSLPELVTSITAVRRGALTLAVGGIIGGNAFDTLFAAVADIAYRPGSIYHAALAESTRELMLTSLTIVMTAVLLMGLLRREKVGVAGIGFESFFVLLLYAAGIALLATM